MIKAILTDIEGTTSSISFVRDVLFPYAAEHLPMFVRANAKDPTVAEQLLLVAQEAGVAETDYPAIIDTLQRWIAEDKKITPLKALQTWKMLINVMQWLMTYLVKAMEI